jgi:hypothetical protein
MYQERNAFCRPILDISPKDKPSLGDELKFVFHYDRNAKSDIKRGEQVPLEGTLNPTIGKCRLMTPSGGCKNGQPCIPLESRFDVIQSNPQIPDTGGFSSDDYQFLRPENFTLNNYPTEVKK